MNEDCWMHGHYCAVRDERFFGDLITVYTKTSTDFSYTNKNERKVQFSKIQFHEFFKRI
jgi:hypothetical protein